MNGFASGPVILPNWSVYLQARNELFYYYNFWNQEVLFTILKNIALALWGHLNLLIKGYWIFNGFYTESVGNLKDIIKSQSRTI